MTREGWSLRYLSRKKPACDVDKNWIQGDIRDVDACTRAVAGADVVIHAAGEKNLINQMNAVNVEGTDNLLNASLRNNVRLFVHISSVGVIGAPPLKKRLWDENAQCNPNNTYEQSKWLAEEKVRQASSSGLQAVILRPTNVFGDQDPSKGLLNLACNIQVGRFFFLGGRDTACNFIFVEDVAQAVVRLVTHSGSLQDVYHINDPCSLGDFVNAFADMLHVRRPKLSMPRIFAEAIRSSLIYASHVQYVSNSNMFARLISLNNCARFDSKRLRNDIGFSHPVGWRVGVSRLVSWYRAQGDL